MKLSQALHDDHQRLDELYEELLNRIHVNDAEAADRAWSAFERGLLDHIDAEEKWMLPLFERLDPAEAAAIRGEHAEILGLLADLGLGLELHVVRERAIEELIASLRAHAAREEASLYRWADAELPAEPRASVLERLRAGLASTVALFRERAA